MCKKKTLSIKRSYRNNRKSGSKFETSGCRYSDSGKAEKRNPQTIKYKKERKYVLNLSRRWGALKVLHGRKNWHEGKYGGEKD